MVKIILLLCLFIGLNAFASNLDSYFDEVKFTNDNLYLKLKDSGTRFLIGEAGQKKLADYGQVFELQKGGKLSLTDRHQSISLEYVERKKLDLDNQWLCDKSGYSGNFAVVIREEVDHRSFGDAAQNNEALLLPYWNDLETTAIRIIYMNIRRYKSNYVILSKSQPSNSLLVAPAMNTNHYEDAILRLGNRLKTFLPDCVIKDESGKSWKDHKFMIDGYIEILVSPRIQLSYPIRICGIDDTQDGGMYISVSYLHDSSPEVRKWIEKAVHGTFTLWISNQTFRKGDAPELTIEVDGKPFAREKIRSDGKKLQHSYYSYPTFLADGKHTLKITGGGIDFEQEFTVDKDNDSGVFLFTRPAWYEFWKNPDNHFETQKGPLLWD